MLEINVSTNSPQLMFNLKSRCAWHYVALSGSQTRLIQHTTRRFRVVLTKAKSDPTHTMPPPVHHAKDRLSPDLQQSPVPVQSNLLRTVSSRDTTKTRMIPSPPALRCPVRTRTLLTAQRRIRGLRWVG